MRAKDIDMLALRRHHLAFDGALRAQYLCFPPSTALQWLSSWVVGVKASAIFAVKTTKAIAAIFALSLAQSDGERRYCINAQLKL